MNTQQALETIKYEVNEEGHCGYIEDELRLAMAALEKQVPKRPLRKNACGDCVVYSCPACKDGRLILDGDNYCTMCGQKLDWGGDDNDR